MRELSKEDRKLFIEFMQKHKKHGKVDDSDTEESN